METIKPSRLAGKLFGNENRFSGALKCRRKFLRLFPDGFQDETYLSWERKYKWDAHHEWERGLSQHTYRRLLRTERFEVIAQQVVRIESRTNLLFSFEKMAIRDALKPAAGAKLFATELYKFLFGSGDEEARFEGWCEAVSHLPRKQTRVLTWPIATVFGFIAQPSKHIFLKPTVTRIAAREYGFEFDYQSRPSWNTYSSLLNFAATCKRDLRDL